MRATSTKNKYTFSNCSCTVSLTSRWCISLCLRCWPCVTHCTHSHSKNKISLIATASKRKLTKYQQFWKEKFGQVFSEEKMSINPMMAWLKLTSVKHMQITEWACSISPTKHIQVVTHCCTSVAVSGCWWFAFHNRFAPCLLHCNKNPSSNQIFVHTFYLQKLNKTTFLSHLTVFLSSYPNQKEHV